MELSEAHVVADRMMQEIHPAFFDWFWKLKGVQDAKYDVIRDAWRGHVAMNFEKYK